MDYKRIIIFLPALLLFSGCGIYTNYHRPESLPVDSLYRDVPEAMQDTSSLADLSWRELFTDSLLVKWIEVGLEKNSDIQTARLLTEEAQASLQASRLAFLPSVSLTPQGSLGSFGGAKPSKTYSLGGTAEWEIDAFGGLRNAKKGSRAALEASRAYEQAVQTQLVATIAETYYSLLALDRKLAITRETARKWGENVRAMKALKRAGERDDAAVAQAEASRLEAESSVLSLERQLHELENSFSTLLGIVPTGPAAGTFISGRIVRRGSRAAAWQASRRAAGGMAAGRSVLCHQQGPLVILSPDYAERLGGMDQQFGDGYRQSGRLAAQCGRLAGTAALQPGA